MMLRLVALLLVLLWPVAALAASPDYGLRPIDVDNIAADEAAFEASVRRVAPGYRLQRTALGDSVRRPAARVSVSRQDTIARYSPPVADSWTEPDPNPPAIAALHDWTTGRVLSACTMPCNLGVPGDVSSFLVIYRYGSLPLWVPTGHALPDGRIMAEGFETAYDLGYNAVDAVALRLACLSKGHERIRAAENRDAEPCYRTPPAMPEDAGRSGHCQMIFDGDVDGRTVNVEATECTDDIFCDPSALAVSRWLYVPKVEDGAFVRRTGIMNTMTFLITDDAGAIIPEPDGPLQPCIGIS